MDNPTLDNPTLPQECNRTSCPPAPFQQALHGCHSMNLGRASCLLEGLQAHFSPLGSHPKAAPHKAQPDAEGSSGSSHTFPTSGSSWMPWGGPVLPEPWAVTHGEQTQLLTPEKVTLEQNPTFSVRSHTAPGGSTGRFGASTIEQYLGVRTWGSQPAPKTRIPLMAAPSSQPSGFRHKTSPFLTLRWNARSLGVLKLEENTFPSSQVT